MVLLTGGQVSVVISSSVVFIFTFLLFLSGYVLQQQTVRSLRAAIKPPPPSIPTPSSPVLAKHFGTPPGHSFFDKYLASNRPQGGWGKVAYVQLVRSHTHVCNAVMVFAELENQESLAQRLLLYPKEWDEADSGQQLLDTRMATSKRLLRDAAKQYKVMLQPVEPMIKLKSESVFPLGGLLSLTSFNRLLLLPPSGLVLDTSGLDHLFTLPMESSILGITTGIRDEKVLPSIILLQPSNEAFQSTLASIPAGSYNETSYLEKIPLVSDMPEDHIHVVARTSDLRLEDRDFNSSKFLEETSYVQFSDSGIIGPEYDISRTKLGLAQPKELQPLRAWQETYRKYMERRMDVCSLDLEPVPPDLRVNKQEG